MAASLHGMFGQRKDLLIWYSPFATISPPHTGHFSKGIMIFSSEAVQAVVKNIISAG